MSEETQSVIRPLIESLSKALALEVRATPQSGESLEAVLDRQELQRCYQILSDALGSPAKEFGEAATFEPKLKQAVDTIGGIRLDQCLFLKQCEGGQLAYAALWPWASDPKRVTLKIGAVSVG